MIARELVSLGIPYVYTLHDSAFSLRTKYWLKRVYIALFETFLLNHAAAIHALSNDGLNDIARLTRQPLTMIPNFVLCPTVELSPPDRRDISFLGRLDIFQKRLDLMLQAYQIYRDQHGGQERLVLIGPSVDDSQNRLEQLCGHLNLKLGDEVVIAGQVSEEKKADLLIHSRFYLQLSRFEGFGMSVVEALALGLPVVISPGIPLAESILKNGAGQVVESPAAAAAALAKLEALSEDAYAAASERALQTYESLYHPDVVKRDILQMYRTVQARSSSVPIPRPEVTAALGGRDRALAASKMHE
jgi:glycosyltransferase involved in cell wall biosynthesis